MLIAFQLGITIHTSVLQCEQQFILYLFDYNQNNQMIFEDAEIDNSGTPTGKGKILGVIVITDNRINKPNQRTSSTDFRCSAYKETEVDPLEFATGGPNQLHDDEFFAQLTRRVCSLEARVQALSKFQVEGFGASESQPRSLKKKNRRKFRELIRDNECPNCRKVYGSETALKYHLKLKHNLASNHSQAQ